MHMYSHTLGTAEQKKKTETIAAEIMCIRNCLLIHKVTCKINPLQLDKITISKYDFSQLHSLTILFVGCAIIASKISAQRSTNIQIP